MKKMIAVLMFVLFGTMTACIEDGAPLPRQDTPDATPPTTEPDMCPTCPLPDAGMPDACPVPPDAPPIVCHGLYVTFTEQAKSTIDYCTGWPASGSGVSLPVGLQVNGGNGVCAITCHCYDGTTILPDKVSGVWLPNGTADVPRWWKPGCKRLPDHPASQPDQAGGTWDGRCDKY